MNAPASPRSPLHPYAGRFEVHATMPEEPVSREQILDELRQMSEEEDRKGDSGRGRNEVRPLCIFFSYLGIEQNVACSVGLIGEFECHALALIGEACTVLVNEDGAVVEQFARRHQHGRKKPHKEASHQ